jgi:Na+-driven multidrug efflux pump
MEEYSELSTEIEQGLNKPFFTAEIETILESFAKNKPHVQILPKVEMVDSNNTLYQKEIFIKKLSHIIKTAIQESWIKLIGRTVSSKSKPLTKFLLLLDCGSLSYIEESETQNLYGQTTIVNSLGDSRDFSELGLLCFTEDDLGNLDYNYLGSKDLIPKDWLDLAFQTAKSHSREIEPIIIEAPENKLHACLELCYQAEQFIENARFNSIEQDQRRDFANLAKILAEKLSSTFYHTRPLSEAMKSNMSYFTAMLLGYLIFAGSRYAETYMIMSKDESLLESSTLPVTIMRVMVLLSVRPLESITMLGATAFGAKKYSELGALLRAGWVASLLLDMISIPILCTSEYWLQHIFRQDAELAKAAGDYLTRYAWGVPAMTATVADHNIFFATNNPGIVTFIELIAVLAGVGLTYTFVFGELGFEAQGLTGFATSLVLQKWITFILAKSYLLLTQNSRKYTIFASSSLSEMAQKIKLIFRKGVPLTLQIGSEQLYLFIVAIYAGLYGKMHNLKTLDQSNILNEYFNLFSISGGLVSHKTAMQRVGEVRGRDLMLRDRNASLNLIKQNLSNVPQIIIANSTIAALYSLLVGGVFVSACGPLVSIYFSENSNEETKKEIFDGICPLFWILAACTVTEMFGNVVNGVLNGLGDVDSPMFRSLFLTVVVGAGLAALLCFGGDLGLTGVFLSSLMAYLLGVFALSKTLHSTYRDLTNRVNSTAENMLTKSWNSVTSCCFPKASNHNELEFDQSLNNDFNSDEKCTSGIANTWNRVSSYWCSFFPQKEVLAVELPIDNPRFEEITEIKSGNVSQIVI